MNQDDAYPAVPETRPGSMVMVSVNGGLYPMKTVTQCRTCMSPHRRAIEQMVLEGQSYTTIAREIEGLPEGRWPHPPWQAIQRHVNNNHMPLGATAERALIERRSKEIGRSLEDHAESLTDYATANELIIQRGMARMSRGELKPTMGDLLNAIRNQHAIKQSTDEDIDKNAWQDALLAYMEEAQRFIPPDRLQEFGQALSKNPILRAMAAKASGVASPPAIEGEVVREEFEK